MPQKRNSIAARRLLGAASALAIALTASATAHAEGQQATFDIPAQPLSEALAEFSRQSKINVVAPSSLTRGKVSNAIAGQMEPAEALQALIGAAAFDIRTEDDGSLILAQTTAGAQKGRLFRVAQVDTQNTEASLNDGDNQNQKERDTIVVTGTNIRGIAPDSSPSIMFDREAIEASGYQSTELFIRSIPQAAGGSIDSRSLNASSLGNDAFTNNVGGNSVNLRGLGSGATLTLLNGQRMAASGNQGGFTDISVIPLSAVDRVEILTDGASAIYGADAIAGVVNFVLREDFSGAETQLGYGTVTEGDLNQFRASQLLGTNWEGGNVFVNYEYFDVDALTPEGKDFAAGAPDPITLTPSTRRHSVFFSANQRVNNELKLSLDGFYANRDTETIVNFGGTGDPILELLADTEQFSIAPSVEFDISDQWQFRLKGNYGKTRANIQQNRLDNLLLGPQFEKNDSSIGSVLAVADGSLFVLPGGAARLAFGGEYRTENFLFEQGAAITEGDRDVYAVFAEALIPLVSEENRSPGLERLELSLAGRYDDYSDFGNSLNPKFGVLWSPLEGLNIRASYGTSFNPPTLGEINSATAQAVVLTVSDPAAVGGTSNMLAILGLSSDLLPEEGETISAGFDFQTEIGHGSFSLSSTYYDITFDELISTIPLPPGGYFAFRTSPEFIPSRIVTENPGQATIDAVLMAARNSIGVFDLAGLVAPDGSLVAADIDFFYDTRVQNLAYARTKGLDFQIQYDLDTSMGRWAAGLSGNYIFELKRQAAETTPVVDLVDTIHNPAELTLRASVGYERGPLSISTFVNYTDSYTDNRATTISVSSYTTADFNLQFDAGRASSSRFLQGLVASVGVINAFNEEPPFVMDDRFSGSGATASSYDPANADPRGRFVYVEVRKRW